MPIAKLITRLCLFAVLLCAALVIPVVGVSRAVLKVNEIAYISEKDGNAEIYLLDLNNGLEMNLTKNSADDYSPVWSPNGAYLAYISRRDGNDDIYILDMDSLALRNLTNHAATDQLPVWSPDSRQLAFVSDRDGNSEVYIANIGSNETHNLSMHDGNDNLPTWSPDGTRIAFESIRCCGSPIFIADMTQGQVYPLGPPDEPLDGRQPIWSPDGEQVLFLRVRGDARNVLLDTVEVFAIDADGSNLRPFVDTGADEGSLIWSPNGETLALLLFLEEGREIYLVNRDGHQGHLLIYDCHALSGNWTGMPSWSPNSEQLAFESECGGSSEIYVVDTNGKNLRRLTHNAARDSFPAWRP